jgi:very-short-patch-repair endonuclease/predicted nucleic acid-binding Zn ribbon protein
MTIYLEKFSKEDLLKIVFSSFDKTELATKLGFSYFNGRISNQITDLLDSHGISTDHFDSSKKVKARRKYPIIKKKCPVCNKEFETQVGNKEERVTCSYSCSNTFFATTRHTDCANSKASNTLKVYHQDNGTARTTYTKDCPVCKASFQSVKEEQITCSNKCAGVLRNQNPVVIERLRDSANQRVANGTHSGWASRKNLKPSFPEKVVFDILAELNIRLEREHKCGKWFIDFADINRKIAIEIDGKQHEWPDRKVSDMRKDTYLISEGWQVHRIKWQKLTKDFREEVKKKLSNILTGPGV